MFRYALVPTEKKLGLVIKFRYRKNIRVGCILIRPCLCALASSSNRAFCPVRGLWTTSRGRMTPEGLLSPNTSANSFDRQLRRAMRNLNYEDDRRYSSRVAHQGDTQDI